MSLHVYELKPDVSSSLNRHGGYLFNKKRLGLALGVLNGTWHSFKNFGAKSF
jgi:hypothetical protein